MIALLLLKNLEAIAAFSRTNPPQRAITKKIKSIAYYPTQSQDRQKSPAKLHQAQTNSKLN